MYIFLILIDCREGKVNFFAMKKSRVVFDILVLNLNLDMVFYQSSFKEVEATVHKKRSQTCCIEVGVLNFNSPEMKEDSAATFKFCSNF